MQSVANCCDARHGGRLYRTEFFWGLLAFARLQYTFTPEQQIDFCFEALYAKIPNTQPPQPSYHYSVHKYIIPFELNINVQMVFIFWYRVIYLSLIHI